MLGLGLGGIAQAQEIAASDGAAADAAAAGGGAQVATDEGTVATILIVGKRADRTSKGATGLALDVAETPQSISVVDRRQMEDFGANNLNDALRLATGINVEEWETNRTNYLARGFEIKSTQIDGVGMPNDWGIVSGAMDAFGYEKLEVIRGANGLLTGVGNAAGTINYVRKRPTNDARFSIGESLGSWDFKRAEIDGSTPLSADGRWAGRVAAAAEDEDSYLRGLSNRRTFLYGVIDGQIGERSTLTFGYSHQQANSDGAMWGALVLAYRDGTQAEFPRSASTALDWTTWDDTNQTAFAEYSYALAERWELKLSYNFRDFGEDAKLFYVFTRGGLNADNTGLLGNPGRYPNDSRAHLADLNLAGGFELFGLEQQLIVGLGESYSKADMDNMAVPLSDPNWGPLPAFPYAGNTFPEPAWGPRSFYSTTKQRLTRAYGAARIGLTPDLKAVLGFNWAQYHRDGNNVYGGPFDQTEEKLSPYAGLSYQLTRQLLAYASYSDIEQPQDQTDIEHHYLDPSKGVNYEAGLKADLLDRRLLTTLAWFVARQDNLATYIGVDDTGTSYYGGVDVESKGFELEIDGKPHEYVDLVLGFTALQLHGDDGRNTYDWVPRRTVNLQLSSKVPGATALTLGLGGRWQSDISHVDEYNGGAKIRQGDYVVLNAFVRYVLFDELTLRLNVNNLTDEKYITSLYQIGYYGAPRNIVAGFDWKF